MPATTPGKSTVAEPRPGEAARDAQRPDRRGGRVRDEGRAQCRHECDRVEQRRDLGAREQQGRHRAIPPPRAARDDRGIRRRLHRVFLDRLPDAGRIEQRQGEIRRMPAAVRQALLEQHRADLDVAAVVLVHALEAVTNAVVFEFPELSTTRRSSTRSQALAHPLPLAAALNAIRRRL